ncbi:hypothetical protein HNQ91_005707 [Filimonas zeae]|uniref:YCII-related domain-containing protein n=1 Tax=Filimonas zeae TaxID=1737353 RepID=A0A917J490_9BACT|nr:YciI family protein [Filimonas zeae]MDR6342623.1 hypothetical protein [Filimonas zeae]GGH82040.1 hypothetical protein GCM10011379_55340 [Filimonas zeae]
MDQFMLIFRRDWETKEKQPSPEQMQASIKPWQDWLGGLAAQNKLTVTPHRLQKEGRVVKANQIVTDGPYAEIKEAIGGFIVVAAADFDEAVAIAQGCPILNNPWDGNVEVRMLMQENENQ